MTKRFFHLLALAFSVAIFTSCNNDALFEKYQNIPDSQWHKDSLVVFEVPVTDTLQNHNLLVNIRNEIDYNYSNLWLFIEIVRPDGKAVKDTFELTLAAPSGKWLGEGFGNLRTQQVMYRRNVNFPVPGEYKVSIQHGMREDILDGISDVGITLQKAGS